MEIIASVVKGGGNFPIKLYPLDDYPLESILCF